MIDRVVAAPSHLHFNYARSWGKEKIINSVTKDSRFPCKSLRERIALSSWGRRGDSMEQGGDTVASIQSHIEDALGMLSGL